VGGRGQGPLFKILRGRGVALRLKKLSSQIIKLHKGPEKPWQIKDCFH
jgi:hypothetical protein